jgi:hypothetical protein
VTSTSVMVYSFFANSVVAVTPGRSGPSWGMTEPDGSNVTVTG